MILSKAVPLGLPKCLVRTGTTTEGLSIQTNPQDPTRALLTVGNEVQGDVIAYASYPSTSGKLVIGFPIVVVSRPVGATLTGISIEPHNVAVSAGDHFTYQIWGKYSNGRSARLYEPVGNAALYVSSNPLIVSVGAANQLTAHAVGTTTLSATFRGFTAQTSVIVKDPLSSQVANISTRLKVGTSDNVLIGGFIITGTQPKKVLICGIGPSLAASGLTGILKDPTLEIHNSARQIIATNNDWGASSDKQAIIQTGIPPTNAKESAVLLTLNPGAYTAILRGVNNTTGVALVEVYDIDRTVDSKLANISTRGLVQTGDNVLIGGLIIQGANPARVIIRAIGPSLSQAGITNPLANPTLELHDAQGNLTAVNDNWQDSQRAEVIATGIPPTNTFESAIVRTLTPGAYTAVVRGKNNTTGVALVEAYQLDN